MSILEQTLELCRLYGIKPARSKGQNFLIVEDFYDRIVAAADLHKSDRVLEVGPGLGFLTAKLAQKAGEVTAVELDDKLANLLKTAVFSKKDTNIKIMHGNALDLMVGQGEGHYKIVANLPYNITSAFLRKFLSQAKQKPDMMVLLLQKEVAERICAQPGQMSLLAVSVQAYADADIIANVPAKAFYPAPEVESAIIRIRIKKTVSPAALGGGGRGEVDGVPEKDFFRLVRIGFSARRKKLANNLAAGFQIAAIEAVAWLKRAGFSENVRAQELSVQDWQKLLSSK